MSRVPPATGEVPSGLVETCCGCAPCDVAITPSAEHHLQTAVRYKYGYYDSGGPADTLYNIKQVVSNVGGPNRLITRYTKDPDDGSVTTATSYGSPSGEIPGTPPYGTTYEGAFTSSSITDPTAFGVWDEFPGSFGGNPLLLSNYYNSNRPSGWLSKVRHKNRYRVRTLLDLSEPIPVEGTTSAVSFVMVSVDSPYALPTDARDPVQHSAIITFDGDRGWQYSDWVEFDDVDAYADSPVNRAILITDPAWPHLDLGEFSFGVVTRPPHGVPCNAVLRDPWFEHEDGGYFRMEDSGIILRE